MIRNTNKINCKKVYDLAQIQGKIYQGINLIRERNKLFTCPISSPFSCFLFPCLYTRLEVSSYLACLYICMFFICSSVQLFIFSIGYLPISVLTIRQLSRICFLFSSSVLFWHCAYRIDNRSCDCLYYHSLDFITLISNKV